MRRPIRPSFYRIHGKRWLDVAFASVLLLLLALPMGVIAILVRVRLGRPILFRQERIGLNEERFYLTKFRTMKDSTGPDGQPLPDAERLTRFGNFLRSSSLDELPELFNILRGDMSLVGPRPLLTRYLPFYTRTERSRHSVRPGLTGLAQVAGRNYLPWNERFALDIKYVETLSLSRDLGLLFRTLFKVLRRSDVAEVPNQIMLDLDQERRPDDRCP